MSGVNGPSTVLQLAYDISIGKESGSIPLPATVEDIGHMKFHHVLEVLTRNEEFVSEIKDHDQGMLAQVVNTVIDLAVASGEYRREFLLEKYGLS